MMKTALLIIVVLLLSPCFFMTIDAGASLLGMFGGGKGGNIKGGTFTVDVSDKKMTKVVGSGVSVDVETLQVATNGGLLEFLSDRIDFTRSMMRWTTVLKEAMISLYHNDIDVMHFLAPEGQLKKYYFRFKGNAGFEEIYINKDNEKQMTYLLCIAEGTLNGDVNIDFCDKEAERSQKSLNQLFETSCKLLGKAATNLQFGGSVVSRDGPGGQSLMVDSLRLELMDDVSNKVDKALKSSNAEKELVALSARFDSLAASVIEKTSNSNNQLTKASEKIENLRIFTESKLVDMNYTIANILSAAAEEADRLLLTSIEEISKNVGDVVALTQSLQIQLNNKLGKSDLDKFKNSEFEKEQLQLQLDRTKEELSELIRESKSLLTTLMHDKVSHLEAVTASNLTALTLEVIVNLQDHKESQTQLMLSLNSTTLSTINLMETNLTSRLETAESRLSSEIALINISTLSEFNSMKALITDSVAALNDSTKLHLHALETSQMQNVTALNASFIQLLSSTNSSLQDDIESAQIEIMSITDGKLALVNTSLWTAWQATDQRVTTTSIELNRLLSELTSNTSSAIGRSNAILARVIGEVNISVVNLAQDAQTTMNAIRAETMMHLTNLKDDTVKAIEAVGAHTSGRFENMDQRMVAFVNESSTATATLLQSQLSNQLQERDEQIASTVSSMELQQKSWQADMNGTLQGFSMVLETSNQNWLAQVALQESRLATESELQKQFLNKEVDKWSLQQNVVKEEVRGLVRVSEELSTESRAARNDLTSMSSQAEVTRVHIEGLTQSQKKTDQQVEELSKALQSSEVKLNILETTQVHVKQVLDSFGLIADTSVASVATDQKAARRDLDSLTARLETLGESLSSADKKLEERLHETLREYATANKETLTSHVATTSDQINAVQERLGKIEAATEVLSQRYLDMQRSHEQAVQSLQASIAEAKRDEQLRFERLEQKVLQSGEQVQVLTRQLALAETSLASQDKKIASLEDETLRLRRDMASQASVDNLRTLLHDMQSSMISHSGKVLDILLAKAEKQ